VVATDIAEYIFITPATPVVLGLGWAGVMDVDGTTPETYLTFCAVSSILLWAVASIVAFHCGWHLLLAWALIVVLIGKLV
jgi:hypothetical protein